MTINNPTTGDVVELIGDRTNPDFEYLIFQYEVGENGTFHLQGFIHYKNPRVMPKKKIPRAHLEPVRCTAAAIKYCSKEESRVPEPWAGPHEFGTRPIKGDDSEQGKRNDLENLAALALNRDICLAQIATENAAAFIRYHKGLIALRNITAPDRTTKPTVYWLHGPAGTGKTRYAMTLAEDKPVFIKDSTEWWDNYEQQPTIIIDDYDKNKFSFRSLLTALDMYAHQAQVKGGYVKILSQRIIITCEFSPYELWSGNELAQVERRIDHVHRFTMPMDQSHKKPTLQVSFFTADGVFKTESEPTRTPHNSVGSTFAGLPGGNPTSVPHPGLHPGHLLNLVKATIPNFNYSEASSSGTPTIPNINTVYNDEEDKDIARHFVRNH